MGTAMVLYKTVDDYRKENEFSIQAKVYLPKKDSGLHEESKAKIAMKQSLFIYYSFSKTTDAVIHKLTGFVI